MIPQSTPQSRAAEVCERLKQLTDAVKESESEATGALKNAFPEEAPDILASVAGKLTRALKAAREQPTTESKSTMRGEGAT